MSKVNVPLLIKTLEHIEFHPEEWVQAQWVTTINKETGEDDWFERQDTPPKECGTAFCFAGHAANIDGWEPVWDGTAYSYGVMRKDGEIEMVEVIAKDALGLTEREADRLFDGDNSLSDLRTVVESIIETRG